MSKRDGVTIFITYFFLLLMFGLLLHRHLSVITTQDYVNLQVNYIESKNQLEQCQGELGILEKKLATLQEKCKEAKEEIEFAKGNTVYYITLRVTGPKGDCKEFEIGVDKDFYDSVSVGSPITKYSKIGIIDSKVILKTLKERKK